MIPIINKCTGKYRKGMSIAMHYHKVKVTLADGKCFKASQNQISIVNNLLSGSTRIKLSCI